jgi:hypothetical protein
MTMPGDDVKPGPVRRIEILMGAGRRRNWSDDDKARIVAESYGGLELVCAAVWTGSEPTVRLASRGEETAVGDNSSSLRAGRCGAGGRCTQAGLEAAASTEIGIG